jgi:hypothetical protein
MSDPTHELWCLIEGDRVVFSVVVSTTTSVDELKEMIKNKNKSTLRLLDAKDIIVLKVCYIMMFK